jgi:hypothetical protein
LARAPTAAWNGHCDAAGAVMSYSWVENTFNQKKHQRVCEGHYTDLVLPSLCPSSFQKMEVLCKDQGAK